MPLDEKPQRRVLVHSIGGEAAYLLIDGDFIGMDHGYTIEGKSFKSPLGIKLPKSLKKQQPDWHHIAVVCKMQNSELVISIFLDGEKPSDQPKMTIDNTKPIGFIGNSKDGECPFGSLADFRIYPYALTPDQVVAIHALRTDPNWERGLPDHNILSFLV